MSRIETSDMIVSNVLFFTDRLVEGGLVWPTHTTKSFAGFQPRSANYVFIFHQDIRSNGKMAYDQGLADRTRDAIGPRTGITEKKMFGGVAFLLDGKMFCGITNDDLMVRVGPADYEASLAELHVRPMDFTGRPMNGYVFVGAKGTKSVGAIRKWVDVATALVATLPRKAARKRRTRSR